MMPLLLANVGEENVIKRIGGSPEVKQHLENLGFVEGEMVRVVSDISVGGSVIIVNTMGGNLIVNVKETRVAVSREMAQKIMI